MGINTRTIDVLAHHATIGIQQDVEKSFTQYQKSVRAGQRDDTAFSKEIAEIYRRQLTPLKEEMVTQIREEKEKLNVHRYNGKKIAVLAFFLGGALALAIKHKLIALACTIMSIWTILFPNRLINGL